MGAGGSEDDGVCESIGLSVGVGDVDGQEVYGIVLLGGGGGGRWGSGRGLLVAVHCHHLGEGHAHYGTLCHDDWCTCCWDPESSSKVSGSTWF